MQNKYFLLIVAISMITVGLLAGLTLGCGSVVKSMSVTTTTSSTSTTIRITYTVPITAEATTFANQAFQTTPQYSLLAHEAGYSATESATRRSFIKFDFSSIPATAIIDSATLYLYVTEVAGADTTIYFYAADSLWDETTLTWQNMPAANGQMGIVQELFSVGQTGSVSIDANSAVQVWHNGSLDNYGMILVSYNNSSTNILKYTSRASTTNKPYLEIVYRN
ncbi:MAG: DNRLRE domain-containing protein [Candidatus Saganbacteria bacterium]|nr:DNRLRE domain-containing protein [Candidatus Saganbacteria bacterium]